MRVEDTRTEAEGTRGWECSSKTEEQPPNNETQEKLNCVPLVLKSGWRRISLYGIIVFLMCLVFLNIALTLWIITTLRLTKNGIGPLTIVRDGIRLEGNAWVTEELVASTISSPPTQPLTVQAHRNFTILVSEESHKERSKLIIKRDSVECAGHMFKVQDARGGSVFQASKDEVRVFADALVLEGTGGVSVRSALQTPFVRAPPGSDLQLESLTRRLDLRAPQSIYLESRAGNIDITSHSNIQLDSVVGAIKIDAPNIIISNLKEGKVTEKAQKSTKGKKIYQLCACASGKLFLAAPDLLCSMHDTDTELCR
ncbi:delta-sarcoglycan-like [Leptidea sinapis]|uniref:delta-sarcoglycan-like n=1 Tax=Leptidea sinapis TaxID=189913 RepID=UPI00212B89EA|nr:delta-sarcoglycan-like [Leptidea sinapis]XP_050677003.1 delta-sarcoglycan-like [Leptidea sinapis]XP_050677005.1 delta-sarcoglycan-like [Leptidea sinapis]